jgi:ribosome biogenesis GTPase
MTVSTTSGPTATPSDLPESATCTGRVRKYHSNYYYVDTDAGLLECSLRGLLKKQGTDVLVGDHVVVDSINTGHTSGGVATGRIIQCEARHNQLSRPKMSNVDMAIVVQSLASPTFDPTQVDRYLTHITLAGIQPLLCITKVDLDTDPQATWTLAAIQALYQGHLGIPVVSTSILNPHSYDPLKQAIAHNVAVLVGQSGAGKSSLLNALNPSLQLRVGAVSDKLQRGQQTTRHVELVPIPTACDTTGTPQAFIADTPGFSHLAFDQVLPDVLEKAFVELAPWRAQCSYPNCVHLTEADCAVRDNPQAMTASRYASYTAMMAEAEAYAETYSVTSRKTDGGVKTVSAKGKDQQITKLHGRHRQASRRVDNQRVGTLRNATVDADNANLLADLEDEL